MLPSENGLNPSRAAVMKSLDWSHSILLVEPSDLFDLVCSSTDDISFDILTVVLGLTEC